MSKRIERAVEAAVLEDSRIMSQPNIEFVRIHGGE
jgi:hypothetical protein